MTCPHGSTSIVCKYCDAETVERETARKHPSRNGEQLADLIEKCGLCTMCDHTDFYGRMDAPKVPPTPDPERDLIVKALRAYARSESGRTAELRYLLESTAKDGQWADQAVHSYVKTMLRIK